MKPFVLDCSVTMSWCFEEEGDQYSDFVLELLKDREAVVPPLWPLEVVNVLAVGEKRKRLKKAHSLRFLELLVSLPIIVDENPPFHHVYELYSLAREHDLSSYDAAYLELSIRRGLLLATKDKILSKAALKCGVGLVLPDT